MSTPVANRKRAALVVPSGASHFTIHQLVKEGDKDRRIKMKGPPEADGQVPDSWPVTQFSAQNVLQMWGDGKYRVEWYTAEGERIAQSGESFDVARPAKRTKRTLSAAARLDEEEEPAPALRHAAAPAPGAGGMGLMEMIALLDKTREQASERDRAFFLQMQQSQATLIAAMMGRAGGGDSAASLEIVQQRLQLEMDRRLFDLRREMLENGQRSDDPDDTEPGDREPPQDIPEAVERIGISFLEQLEGAAPELVQKMVPRFLEMLKSQGLAPSPEMQQRIAQAQNGHAHRS